MRSGEGLVDPTFNKDDHKQSKNLEIDAELPLHIKQNKIYEKVLLIAKLPSLEGPAFHIPGFGKEKPRDL